jgi:hypothetical protein
MDTSNIFRVDGMIAVVTGGATGKSTTYEPYPNPNR